MPHAGLIGSYSLSAYTTIPLRLCFDSSQTIVSSYEEPLVEIIKKSFLLDINIIFCTFNRLGKKCKDIQFHKICL
jgi:hypothetical protein